MPRIFGLQAFPDGWVWATTAQGLRVTNDGGETWRDATPDSALTPPSSDTEAVPVSSFVLAQDPASTWIVPRTLPDYTDIHPPVTLLHTTDGGATWSRSSVRLDLRRGEDTYAGAAQVFFLDEQRGWLLAALATGSAFSRAVLYRTTDGGASWTKVTAPANGDIVFTTPQDGWLAGGPTHADLYVTHDGGVTWEEVAVPQRLPSPIPTPTPAGPVTPCDRPARENCTPFPGRPSPPTAGLPNFFDATNGVMPVHVQPLETDSSSVYFNVTHDGGRTWTPAGPPISLTKSVGDLLVQGLSKVSLVDAENWFLLADRLYATQDGGKSWSVVSAEDHLLNGRYLDFVSPEVGWLYEESSSCSGPKDAPLCSTVARLLKTTDGGRTWTEVSME